MTWGPVEIIGAFVAWHESHGAAPRSVDWRASSPSHPSSSTVIRIFGSWNAAVEAAGLTPRLSRRAGQRQWDRDTMKHAFFLWVFRHGRQPSERDWNLSEEGRPTEAQAGLEYGSWNAFVVACGYTPRKPHRTLQGYTNQAGATAKRRASTTGRFAAPEIAFVNERAHAQSFDRRGRALRNGE